MAIVEVSRELAEDLDVLKILIDYFDKIESLVPTHVGIKRYWVEGEGLPKEDTVIMPILKIDDDNGKLYIYKIEQWKN